MSRLLATAAKDDGVCWEETGIDYLFVDEAHLYKNRQVVTQVDGVATAGSQRAQQLEKAKKQEQDARRKDRRRQVTD